MDLLHRPPSLVGTYGSWEVGHADGLLILARHLYCQHGSTSPGYLKSYNSVPIVSVKVGWILADLTNGDIPCKPASNE
jgi:hypothetical protein